MKKNKTAFLFPAFAMRYREFSRHNVEGFAEEAAAFYERAIELVDIDPRKFEHPVDFALSDEFEDDLQSHYVSYIDCCAVASLLVKQGVACDYVAGYSMGLFAALYQSGAVGFEDGLHLLYGTCSAAHRTLTGGEYGMAVVVGLTPREICGIVDELALRIEIGDICGPRVVIGSGLRADLAVLVEAAEAVGSLQARFLSVTSPFHSSLLQGGEARIREYLGRIHVVAPTTGLLSCVNQALLTSAEAVQEEAATNLWRPMRWYDSMQRLVQLGVGVFVECGPSESLCNLARHVEGEFRTYHPRKFDRLFATVR
jgi:[acyl-carrier-protein] S-malonyltransferase